ncbi:hypothetical protein [Candidatus Rhabdochlamydia porcellionis]|jgi:hypothetical protein|uniref:Uncharacterized protein n=1 Tax=Candidatus Rhabdochlamydia porcellionis TaxID=225148 RepID=A0ABX8YZD3_9BACT|nr:hypothetical protein [Candidatus Rhabdochlamydia porcellionis]QZA58724.1 hypothetical protein RHAB15C_0000603 [Candidatus Rhabdochlamydia porcellionis]
MTSILQTATSVIRAELAFNSLCREMAKDNISLAYNYIKSAVTGVSTHLINGSTASISLKNRCINLIKAPLLLLRAPLLCLPLTNRVTQLALCFLFSQKPADFASPFHLTNAELMVRYNRNTPITFVAEKPLEKNILKNKEFNPSMLTNNTYVKLSPPLSIDLINSLEFKEDEIKVRYSEDTRRIFMEDYFKDKIAQKEKITKSDLDLSKEEQAIFIGKLGFTYSDCNNIFLKYLMQFPKTKYSISLKKEINQYKKLS